MKKSILILAALGILGAAPAFAAHNKDVHQDHHAAQTQKDMDCREECDLLINDCTKEITTIQQRVQKIKADIKEKGAKPENQEELRVLNKKLKEVNETLKALTKPGH